MHIRRWIETQTWERLKRLAIHLKYSFWYLWYKRLQSNYIKWFTAHNKTFKHNVSGRTMHDEQRETFKDFSPSQKWLMNQTEMQQLHRWQFGDFKMSFIYYLSLLYHFSMAHLVQWHFNALESNLIFCGKITHL